MAVVARTQVARHRGIYRLITIVLLPASGSGLPAGPAQFVKQERREEAD